MQRLEARVSTCRGNGSLLGEERTNASNRIDISEPISLEREQSVVISNLDVSLAATHPVSLFSLHFCISPGGKSSVFAEFLGIVRFNCRHVATVMRVYGNLLFAMVQKYLIFCCVNFVCFMRGYMQVLHPFGRSYFCKLSLYFCKLNLPFCKSSLSISQYDKIKIGRKVGNQNFIARV